MRIDNLKLRQLIHETVDWGKRWIEGFCVSETQERRFFQILMVSGDIYTLNIAPPPQKSTTPQIMYYSQIKHSLGGPFSATK